MTDPQLLGVLRSPAQRRRRTAHLESQVILASRRHLRQRQHASGASVEPEQHARHVLGRHRCRLRIQEALRYHGCEVRHHFDDPLTADETDEIQPVRTDVTDDAQRSADFRVETPVPVGVLGQPVLQVGAGDEAHRTGDSGIHPRGRLLAERIEAGDEADGVDEAQILGGVPDFARLRRRHRQRFLADHVLPGPQRRERLFVVAVVRRADVDGVDPVVGQHVGEAGVRLRDSRRRGALGRGSDDA